MSRSSSAEGQGGHAVGTGFQFQWLKGNFKKCWRFSKSARQAFFSGKPQMTLQKAKTLFSSPRLRRGNRAPGHRPNAAGPADGANIVSGGRQGSRTRIWPGRFYNRCRGDRGPPEARPAARLACGTSARRGPVGLPACHGRGGSFGRHRYPGQQRERAISLTDHRAKPADGKR